MSDINQMIRMKNWAAVEAAGNAGPPAVAIAEPYLKDGDEVVRLLAVDVIIAAGGPRAPELLMSMLTDKNEQVRINAVNGLHKRPPIGREDDLLRSWDRDTTR